MAQLHPAKSLSKSRTLKHATRIFRSFTSPCLLDQTVTELEWFKVHMTVLRLPLDRDWRWYLQINDIQHTSRQILRQWYVSICSRRAPSVAPQQLMKGGTSDVIRVALGQDLVCSIVCSLNVEPR